MDDWGVRELLEELHSGYESSRGCGLSECHSAICFERALKLS
jgi:hypothetical protein